MSDIATPRTDANTYYAETLAIAAEKIRAVHADFARQLERELFETQEANIRMGKKLAETLDQIENQKDQIYCATDLLEKAIKQRDRLAEASLNLITVRGRHNTQLAFEQLREAIAAVEGGQP